MGVSYRDLFLVPTYLLLLFRCCQIILEWLSTPFFRVDCGGGEWILFSVRLALSVRDLPSFRFCHEA